MKTTTLVRIAAVLILGAASVSAFAVQRTFVASFGNDANPCSITSPCRGFTRALTLTDPNGEVIVLDSAGYGVVTITQSVSIIAPEGVYAGITAFTGQDGVTISAGPGDKVVLRGLTINGQGGGNGIQFVQGAELHVERCVIGNMQLNGLNATAAGSQVFISDTVVRDSGNDGLAFAAALSATLENLRVERNAFDGIVVGAQASATVRHAVVAGNGETGIVARNTTGTGITRLTLDGSVVSGNPTGGVRLSASIGTGAVHGAISRSAITRNGVGINAITGIGTTISVSASDNVVTDNAGHGLRADQPGVAFTASRNVVMRNVTGLNQSNGAVFRSRGDNTVAENPSGNTIGSITLITAPDGL